jgi:amino acid transporter
MAESAPRLERALGARAITIYAVGDILGAGIYALVGRVVAVADSSAWIAFVVAAVLALLTGLTYAEWSSRVPVAAGAAAYCRRAFPHPAVAFLVGVFVLASGITSAATVSLAFFGYLDPFVHVPPALGSVVLLVLMSVVSYRGIRESSNLNIALTALEVSGLLFVLAVGIAYATGFSAGEVAERLTPRGDVTGVLSGVTLAFYAYIGFEDTVNVAEEVRDAKRVLPRAILRAIAFCTFVYVAIAVTALAVVPLQTLVGSPAPLLEVLAAAGVQLPGGAFSIIALFAICNTGLLNLIMASRLTYGMARQGLLPQALARVHPVRHTPWVAVIVAFVLAAALALSGGVQVLAQTTSLLLLCVFTVLHVGLLRVKLREPDAGPEVFVAPRWTPLAGAILCGGMVLNYPADAYARAALVLAGGVVVYLLLGRNREL